MMSSVRRAWLAIRICSNISLGIDKMLLMMKYFIRQQCSETSKTA
jgi:hypothetical protein